MGTARQDSRSGGSLATRELDVETAEGVDPTTLRDDHLDRGCERQDGGWRLVAGECKMVHQSKNTHLGKLSVQRCTTTGLVLGMLRVRLDGGGGRPPRRGDLAHARHLHP